MCVFVPLAPKSMQDGWGGGEDMGLSAGQWEQDEGDMWNSTASQESNSSCNSWGNPPKKGPPKVKKKKKLLKFNRIIVPMHLLAYEILHLPHMCF